MSPPRPSRRGASAFSLVELVIVVVIIGIIAAIAVPRMSSASDDSRLNAIRADLHILDSAVEYYAVEHEGRLPTEETDGSTSTDSAVTAARLLKKTNESGASTTATFGPYLHCIPRNPLNKLATFRIDGAAAGAGTHGWRFNTIRRRFEADDALGCQLTSTKGGVVPDVITGGSVEALSAGAVAAPTGGTGAE